MEILQQQNYLQAGSKIHRLQWVEDNCRTSADTRLKGRFLQYFLFKSSVLYIELFTLEILYFFEERKIIIPVSFYLISLQNFRHLSFFIILNPKNKSNQSFVVLCKK